jgi:hypothetical protein
MLRIQNDARLCLVAGNAEWRGGFTCNLQPATINYFGWVGMGRCRVTVGGALSGMVIRVAAGR